MARQVARLLKVDRDGGADDGEMLHSLYRLVGALDAPAAADEMMDAIEHALRRGAPAATHAGDPAGRYLLASTLAVQRDGRFGWTWESGHLKLVSRQRFWHGRVDRIHRRSSS